MLYNKSHLPKLPSVDEYVEALRGMNQDGFITPKQYSMLINHYHSPNHIITATELADSVDYKSWSGANLQYGLFGKNLRDYMNYNEPGQQSYVLAYFIPPGTKGNSDWLFIMHEEVAQALVKLKWV